MTAFKLAPGGEVSATAPGPFRIDVDPADFNLLRMDPDEFSLWQLDSYIHNLRHKGLDPGGYFVDRDLKYAMPLACVIMAALGLALSLDPLPRSLSIGRSFTPCDRDRLRLLADVRPDLVARALGPVGAVARRVDSQHDVHYSGRFALPVRGGTLMPTDSIELLTLPAVRDFLAFERIGHLATADAEGAPHNVPLCYWFNGTHISTSRSTRSPNADARWRCAGCAISRLIPTSRWSSTITKNIGAISRTCWYTGTPHVVDDREEYMLALRNLRDKYPQYRAMALSIENNPVVRIDPMRVHVWGERFKPTAPGAVRAQSG